MKEKFSKIFTRNTCLALLVGLSFFGIFKYVEYRLDFISDRVAKINNEIIASQNKLNKINKIDEMANAVNTLSQLSKIDSKLLKKYSKIDFLNENYIPASLSQIGSVYLSDKSVNSKILSEVLPYLENLIKENNKEGMSLLVLSAYRSFGTQANLKTSYIMTYGLKTANRFSADQGYSEHQLGTVIDFTTKAMDGKLEGFEKTPEYAWLLENAHKFGFILSYPIGNPYYKFEPWHWRFVGISLATKLYDEKINFYDADQRMVDSYLVNIFEQP